MTYNGLCASCRADFATSSEAVHVMERKEINLEYLEAAARANAAYPMGRAMLIALQETLQKGSRYGWK